MYSVIDLEDLADKIHNRSNEVYIVDTLKHYDIKKWENLSIVERQKLLDFAYSVYLKDDTNLSLGCICDSVMENYKDIIKGKVDRDEFLDYIVMRWE